MGKGIIRCGLKIDGIHNKFIEVGDIIFIPKDVTYEFYIEADSKFFDRDSTNLEEKVNTAKWAYLSDGFFDTAQKKGKEIYTEWGYFNENRSSENVPYLGIGNQYKLGKSLQFQFSEKSGKINSWIGNGYRVEVFNKIPNAGLYFTIVPYLDPIVRFGYFEIQTDIDTKKSKENEVTDKSFFYGESVKLRISLHRLCNSKLENNSFFENCDLSVLLTDGDNGSVLQKNPLLVESLSKLHSKFIGPNSGWLNSTLEFNLDIQEQWKDIYHTGIENRNYSVEIQLIDKTTNTFSKFNIRENNYTIYGNSSDQEHNVRYRTSNFFSVKKSAFDIAAFKETEKSNMIQYIGDVIFTKKEFDPCHFTEIIIQQDGGKDESKKRIIFKELEKTVADNTNLYYDVVAGDAGHNTATVDVVVKGLEHNNVFCQGILLEDGKKHTDIHSIFRTNKILSARHRFPVSKEKESLRESKQEETKVKVDNTRVEINKIPIHEKQELPQSENNYENENVEYKPDTEEEGDYDLVAVSEYDVRDVLDLQEGKDFTIVENEAEKSATFTFKKLSYFYNESYDTKLAQYLGYDRRSDLDGILDSIWAFNYFLLFKELAQTYFVPISTCRYPNQIAKVRVFPDIKWEAFILIVPADSLAYDAVNIEHSPQKADHEKKTKGAYKSSNPNLVDYKVEMHIKSTIKGEVTDLSVGLEQKIGNYLSAISAVKTMLDFLSHKNKVVTGAGAGAQKMIAKVGKKAILPVFIDFSLPSLHVGGSWRFEVPKGEKEVAVIGSADIALRPLLKGKGGIDLIAAMHYIPVVGEVILALEVMKDVAELAITSFTPLDVSARMWFNIYAFGQVDLKLSVDFYNAYNTTLEPKVTLGIGLELGMKIEASVKKIVFIDGKGDRETVGGIGGELSGKGETGLELKAKTGVNTENLVFVEGSVSFIGITLEVVGKLEIDEGGDKKSKPPTPKGKFQVVDRKDDFAKYKWTLK